MPTLPAGLGPGHLQPPQGGPEMGLCRAWRPQAPQPPGVAPAQDVQHGAEAEPRLIGPGPRPPELQLAGGSGGEHRQAAGLPLPRSKRESPPFSLPGAAASLRARICLPLPRAPRQVWVRAAPSARH